MATKEEIEREINTLVQHLILQRLEQEALTAALLDAGVLDAEALQNHRETIRAKNEEFFKQFEDSKANDALELLRRFKGRIH
jgi:hypothetical protein